MVQEGGIELTGFISLCEAPADLNTPMYGAILALVLGGEGGALVSRREVLALLAKRGWVTQGLDAHLGVRRYYHAAVVAHWIGC